MKVCSKCKTEHSLDNFTKEKSRKDGLYPWCKPCLKKHKQDRYIRRDKKFRISHKICSSCKEDKPRSEFAAWDSSRNLKDKCISCETEQQEHKALNIRKCSSCKNILHIDKFYQSRQNGTRKTCIDCLNKQLQQPCVKEYRRDKNLKKFFGISLEQYRELLKKQNHICPICLKPLEGISNPVDHAHRGLHEGKIRAILHDRCNRFVMHSHHDSGELFRAAVLIDTPLTDWVVPFEYLKSRKKKRKKRKKS